MKKVIDKVFMKKAPTVSGVVASFTSQMDKIVVAQEVERDIAEVKVAKAIEAQRVAEAAVNEAKDEINAAQEAKSKIEAFFKQG
jgi:hypothetical protein